MATKLLLLTAISLIGSAAAAAPLTQSYKWFDGKRTHTVWLDPDLVAEYGPPADRADEGKAVKAHAPASTLQLRKGRLRVWKLGSPKLGARGAVALNKIKSAAPTGAFSPVFRSGAVTEGDLLTLPGDIIVFFKLDWTEARIKEFVKERGLEIRKKSPMGPNVYILKTEPGLSSLEKANELHLSGEVLRALPNWQRQLKPL